MPIQRRRQRALLCRGRSCGLESRELCSSRSNSPTARELGAFHDEHFPLCNGFFRARQGPLHALFRLFRGHTFLRQSPGLYLILLPRAREAHLMSCNYDYRRRLMKFCRVGIDFGSYVGVRSDDDRLFLDWRVGDRERACVCVSISSR